MKKKILNKKDKKSVIYKNLNKTDTYLPEEIIENNPEFWKKTTEKDYEIISLKIKGRIVTESRKGTWSGGIIETCSLNWLLMVFPKSINAVIRLSDGEIFTVGDVLKVGTHKCIINRFIINEKDMLIIEYFYPDKRYQELSTLEHI